jgi:putative MATE family efflux protein
LTKDGGVYSVSTTVRTPSLPLRGRFASDLLRIGLPIAAQNLVSASVNMLATIMVGRLGETRLAAVGLGNQVYFLLMLLLFGITTGGGVFTAQYWGKKDLAGVRRTVGLSLALGLSAGLVFLVAALAAPSFLIGLYSRDAQVIALGSRYLRISALGYLPLALSSVLGLSMRSVEKVRLPLLATSLSLALSLFLSWVLIFGKLGSPALGVEGAAWAGVAARVIESLLLAGCAWARRYPCVGSFRQMTDWSLAWAKRYVGVALPVVLNEVTWSIGITLYSVIFARAGTAAVAAYNVANTVSQLAMVIFFGTGNAAAVMIGKKIGEGDRETAFTYARRFSLLAPLLGLAVGALLIPFRLLLPLLFSLAAAVIAQASAMLLVLAGLYPFKVFNFHLIVGVCRAGGDTRFGMFYDLFGVWGLALPLAGLGAFVWGLPAWGIFLLTAADDVGKSFIGLWRLLSKRWLHDLTEEASPLGAAEGGEGRGLSPETNNLAGT